MKYVWLALLYLLAIGGGMGLAAALFNLWWLLTRGQHASEAVLYSIMALGLVPALWAALRETGAERRHGRIALVPGLLTTILCGILIWYTN